MNEDARIALLQEIVAGLIERGLVAPEGEAVTDDVPLRLAELPLEGSSATSTSAAGESPSRIGKAPR